MVPELTPSILNLYINNAWCVIDGEEWIISHRIAEDFARKKISLKPILRSMHSITLDEAEEIRAIELEGFQKGGIYQIMAQSRGFLHMVSKGIDIFGLIEAGLAIEK